MLSQSFDSRGFGFQLELVVASDDPVLWSVFTYGLDKNPDCRILSPPESFFLGRLFVRKSEMQESGWQFGMLYAFQPLTSTAEAATTTKSSSGRRRSSRSKRTGSSSRRKRQEEQETQRNSYSRSRNGSSTSRRHRLRRSNRSKSKFFS